MLPKPGTTVTIKKSAPSVAAGMRGQVAGLTADDQVVVITENEAQITIHPAHLDWIDPEMQEVAVTRLSFGDREWVAVLRDEFDSEAFKTPEAFARMKKKVTAIGIGQTSNGAVHQLARVLK